MNRSDGLEHLLRLVRPELSGHAQCSQGGIGKLHLTVCHVVHAFDQLRKAGILRIDPAIDPVGPHSAGDIQHLHTRPGQGEALASPEALLAQLGFDTDQPAINLDFTSTIARQVNIEGRTQNPDRCIADRDSKPPKTIMCDVKIGLA